MWWLALIIISIIAFFVILNRNAAADEARMREKRLRRIEEGDYEFVLEEHRQRLRRRADALEQIASYANDDSGNDDNNSRDIGNNSNNNTDHIISIWQDELDFNHPTTELTDIAEKYPHDTRISELIEEIIKTNHAIEKLADKLEAMN